MRSRPILFTATLAVVLAAQLYAADPAERTRSLISVLRSEAPLYEKARACQQLGEFGTVEAIPVLAGLLSDTNLNAYARSGLEGIGGPESAAALRNAALRLKRPLLAGVVNSLAALRDPESVPLLKKLAADPESGVTAEALLALGNIASPDCTRYLSRALKKGPEAQREAAAAACLLAAEQCRRAGELKTSRELFDTVRTTELPVNYRVAATRGAIVSRGGNRARFLVEQLRSDELAIRNAALSTVREIPDDALATALHRELARSGPELQSQILLALADCHNAQSVKFVEGLVASADDGVRKTALSVLGRLGPEAAPGLIAALQQGRSAEERAIVVNGLRNLEGEDVNDLLAQALKSGTSPGVRADLIRLLDSRGATEALPHMVRYAADPETQVSLAALAALRSMGGSAHVGHLLWLARESSDSTIRDAAENAVVSICARSGDCAKEPLLGLLKQAFRSSERNLLVRVLARLAYAPALLEIQKAAADPNAEVAVNALEQLAAWPNPTPMNALLEVVKSGATPSVRQRALLSTLELASAAVDEKQAPPDQVVGWLSAVAPAVQSTVEQRRLIGLLGRLSTVESLRLLAPFMENAALRTEAATALLQVAAPLAQTQAAAELKLVLEQIAAAASTPELQDRARKLLATMTESQTGVSLFDGRTLAGWEGNSKVWRVVDGAIVGGSMQGNPRNEFLATVRPYTNFILRLEYKLVGTEGFINGGVQFRSTRIKDPPNEMRGYQADIGAGYSGCLYDESRRNKVLVQADGELMKRLEKPGDWNLYEIRAAGDHIELWLNGEKTVNYTESDATIERTGLFGLQIHGDCKAEIAFRNITIKEL